MMTFDWTTFVLEILNFLVLVWLLQRLLYKPVLTMLDARQQRLREQAEQADKALREAESMRLDYQNRLAEWAKQQQASRDELEQELARQRSDALAQLQLTLAEEEAKQRSRNQSAQASRDAELTREAAATAYQQTAAMLQRMASPQLTERIAEIFLEDLNLLAEDQHSALQKAAAMLIDASAREIVSAHPLAEATRQQLTEALSAVTGKELSFSFLINSDLIAGLRVVVGECQLHANLADELAFFRRQVKHER